MRNHQLTYSSRESYNHVSSWLNDARALANPDISIVLVGNKIDLTAERQVTFLEASRFAQENGGTLDNNYSHLFFPDLLFIETSAMTGEGVSEVFLKCARAILTKIETGTNQPYFLFLQHL